MLAPFPEGSAEDVEGVVPARANRRQDVHGTRPTMKYVITIYGDPELWEAPGNKL